MALVLILMSVVIGALLVGIFWMERSRRKPQAAPEGVAGKPCPLCGSVLKPGERVHSVVYKTQTADKIMEIEGCPHCVDQPRNGVAALPRRCPVCRKTLRPGDRVLARVFIRPGGKTHVHVLGCPLCRKPGT